MESVQKVLKDLLESNGYGVGMVSVARLKDLENEIHELHTSGRLDEEFYEKDLTGFVFDYEDKLPSAKSIIIAAIPQRITKLYFNWEGKRQEITIPPTYIWEGADDGLQDMVEKVLKKDGYAMVRARLPLKLLAVRSGLSKYGRNNISYIEGMGSFNRLLAWVTDADCEEECWQEGMRMAQCEHCKACLESCPTKAIVSERSLICAERCLTNLNEYGGAFPDWVDSNWHHAIIGCMRCQSVCPANRNFLQPVDIEDAFTEEEIGLLLRRTEIDLLPESTRQTLNNLSMTEYYNTDVLHRNLKLLL